MTRSPEPVDYRVGDFLRLRKPHACGGADWKVFRLGADIGIRCSTCGRRMMMSRRDLEKKTRTVLERGPQPSLTLEGHIASLGPTLSEEDSTNN